MQTFKDCLDIERSGYFKTSKDLFKGFIFSSNDYSIWKFQESLRKAEFYKERIQKSRIYLVQFIYFRRRKNRLGRKLGFDIPEGCFDTGLRIYHISPIVINAAARIGKNCVLVGDVCIGNVKGQTIAPLVGENCMFGWGSAAIGNIEIADYCSIGAGAIVVKDVLETHAVLFGVPAKSRREENDQAW